MQHCLEDVILRSCNQVHSPTPGTCAQNYVISYCCIQQHEVHGNSAAAAAGAVKFRLTTTVQLMVTHEVIHTKLACTVAQLQCELCAVPLILVLCQQCLPAACQAGRACEGGQQQHRCTSWLVQCTCNMLPVAGFHSALLQEQLL